MDGKANSTFLWAYAPRILAAVSDPPAAGSGVVPDDGPQLVLADLLQEEGHPWGELIAVQCALEHQTGPTPERAQLLRREHELVTTTAEWWPFDGVGFEVQTFRRGFPARVLAANVAGLRTLVSRMPWLNAENIEITLHESEMLALVGLDRLPTRGFTFVCGPSYYFDLLDAKMFVRWLELHALVLRRFGMHGMADNEALTRVFSTPMTTRQLEDASFANVSRGWSWPFGPAATMDAPLTKRLSITREGVIATAAIAPYLEDLELASYGLPRPEYIASLARARRLSLFGNALDDAQAIGVLDAAPPGVKVFGFSQNPIGVRTIERLVARPALEGAELWSTKIGDEGVELLAQTSCEVLEIANVGMTERGARLLARSSTLPPTLRLTVSRAEAGPVLPALRERFAVVIAV